MKNVYSLIVTLFLFCSQIIYEETTIPVVFSVLGVLTHYYFLSYYNTRNRRAYIRRSNVLNANTTYSMKIIRRWRYVAGLVDLYLLLLLITPLNL